MGLAGKTVFPDKNLFIKGYSFPFPRLGCYFCRSIFSEFSSFFALICYLFKNLKLIFWQYTSSKFYSSLWFCALLYLSCSKFVMPLCQNYHAVVLSCFCDCILKLSGCQMLVCGLIFLIFTLGATIPQEFYSRMTGPFGPVDLQD